MNLEGEAFPPFINEAVTVLKHLCIVFNIRIRLIIGRSLHANSAHSWIEIF